MVRIAAIGSRKWKSTRQTQRALRRVVEMFKPPYVLMHDGGDGAPRYAAVNADRMGWTIEPHEVDPTKCTDECPPPEGHRRKGGSTGSYCPLARMRALHSMLDAGADLVLAFVTAPDTRLGQAEAARRGVGVWEFVTVKEGTPRGNA